MLPHQQRVVDELNELKIKHTGLLTFLGTELYRKLKQGEKNRLSRQLGLMSQYIDVLVERIEAFSEQEGGSATL